MQAHDLTSELSLSSLPTASLLRRNLDSASQMHHPLSYPVRMHFTSSQDRDGAGVVFPDGRSLGGGECGLCTVIRCLSPAFPGRQLCLVQSGGSGRPWNASRRAGVTGFGPGGPESSGLLLFSFGGLGAVRLASPPVSARALGITRPVAAVLL